jgi:hypothetical protein
MGPIGCPETLVNNFQSAPRNIAEDRKSYSLVSSNLRCVRRKQSADRNCAVFNGFAVVILRTSVAEDMLYIYVCVCVWGGSGNVFISLTRNN